MNTPFDDMTRWIGNRTQSDDVITPSSCAAMAATLGWVGPPPRDGEAIGPLWHWMYFTDKARSGQLGADGHPVRGGFLPPIALPRRMFAGARVRFDAPLYVGEKIHRHSEITAIAAKKGRSGALVFVTIRHRIEGPQGPALEEEHDIVFRGARSAQDGSPEPKPFTGAVTRRRRVMPDPVLLFRYSALTFNGHRIHYDHPYATHVEGYPDLVVHGPLIATLLADFAREAAPERSLASFTFRAKAPLFANRSFDIVALEEGGDHDNAPDTDARARVCALTPEGARAMEASATFHVRPPVG
ncbi:FAS1-like dehydratase domain-containing protein [Varunaivibrio sulfuroxidans]|uniref:3-methylfumaryl-CoA hydratase n=1 Tax=Varunaivibrio sulfuroxidans TaxID=1773489 RepID=A0A4R3JAN6_9PROT|nr:MaoC family dehydratase N-terminal domain-containing protein [Varunaivibrio sulfuroxidans]TCS62634.1 3-methylfumaryl-CoA hydratase [Varunaivibrio sulfuroxidans]WES30699.1 MaoC family dehydratase N-terminal domain-containing protein [Varunaivibrio sulfuroxidans]